MTTKFIEVTRVFKYDGERTVNNQRYTVAVDAIASVRPSNMKGFPEHRTTIVLRCGSEVTLADIYSDMRRKLGAA